MPINAFCSCGKTLNVPDAYAGKKVRCPACQSAVQVPMQDDELDLSAPVSVVSQKPTQCHEVDYEIHGDDIQLVEIELDPGETVIAEAGAMTYMEDDIEYITKMGDGSEPNQGIFGKLMSVGKRVLTGESIFMTHFTNRGSRKRRTAFAAPYPGKIIPVNMLEMGGDLLCQKDCFLCAAHGMKISIAFQKKFGAGFFGGEGFILQRLQGDGMAFIHSCGAIIRKELTAMKRFGLKLAAWSLSSRRLAMTSSVPATLSR